jgi:tetratricopeptide (TPR) repeat protein
MRILLCLTGILVIGALHAFSVPAATWRADMPHSPGSAALVNRIDGIVWAPNHSPVSDVYVELQNEMMMSLSRIRTDSSGRFSFTVTNSGNYVVKVLAGPTNFMDASEVVEIVDLTRNSSDQVHVDIYLKYDKRKINTGSQGVAEAVFAQEVPDPAKKLYESGLRDIQSNPTQAFQELDDALKIFPDYFAALNLAGNQYVQQKEYQKSLPYLIKAVQVNERSYASFYALAYACYQLNHRPEATEAARGAVILGPGSASAQLLYGTLLRLNGDNANAEKALLRAKELRKGTPMPEIHMQLAMLYNRTKRNTEAVVELEAYLKEAPDAANKKEVVDLIAKLKKDIT